MLLISNKLIKVHNLKFILYVDAIWPQHDETELLHLTEIVFINN